MTNLAVFAVGVILGVLFFYVRRAVRVYLWYRRFNKECLPHWGTLLNVPRLDRESDKAYRRRLVRVMREAGERTGLPFAVHDVGFSTPSGPLWKADGETDEEFAKRLREAYK